VSPSGKGVQSDSVSTSRRPGRGRQRRPGASMHASRPTTSRSRVARRRL